MAGSSHLPPGQQLGTGDIEVDVDIFDGDSAYAESTHQDDTQTLASEATKFKWEHGRRYHAYGNGEYWGPNDEKQLDAEDMVHQMFLTILRGRLFQAPIPEDPHRVLDVGCGTGIWTIDFADQYPSAEVIGVDLSPVQPQTIPPNCRFEIDDINKDWTWGENTFDFIHVRMLTGSIRDWDAFYQKCLKALRPGGWIEQVELSSHTKSDDGTITPDLPFKEWADVFLKLGEMTGQTFQICEEAKGWIEKAGFENVTENVIKLPIGPWAKDERLKEWGVWSRVYLSEALEGFALRGLTNHLGWSYEKTQIFLTQMRHSLRDPKLHGWVPLSVVDAQKPMA
ncbi:S-adenosyl-L-methionine-dependent methyltransferase [Zalerion maritima]|uniref:S-adenosyl-L-methionine-dependent methyltransferase n=1 Tax=Zalerion maritima TaxID=339359 RepID=A0AAD5RZY5_9PEZI|nr:S-adenosyl-L-methionine-dependent methyltransferase [Zalerion maritima]